MSSYLPPVCCVSVVPRGGALLLSAVLNNASVLAHATVVTLITGGSAEVASAGEPQGAQSGSAVFGPVTLPQSARSGPLTVSVLVSAGPFVSPSPELLGLYWAPAPGAPGSLMLQPSPAGWSTPGAAWYSACGAGGLRSWDDRVVPEADVLSSDGPCAAQVFMDTARAVSSGVLQVALASPAGTAAPSAAGRRAVPVLSLAYLAASAALLLLT